MPDQRALMPSSHRLLVVEVLDSTNAEALRRATDGEVGPLWIMAGSQTSGRGRSGRRWVSRPGNLYASLLLSLNASAAIAHQLALLAGVAVFDAIAGLAEFGNGSGGAAKPSALDGLRLKWPNDVLIDSAKCAGILAETINYTAPGGAGGLKCVIGIGVNLVHGPQNLGARVTHLAAHGINADPERMLAALANAVELWLGIWQEGRGFGEVRRAWLDRAGACGEQISINTGNKLVSGSFAGIDETGSLLMLDSNGASQRFTFGDVSLCGAGHGE